MAMTTRAVLGVLLCFTIACQPADRTASDDPVVNQPPAATSATLEPFEDPATGLWGYADAAGTPVVTARFQVAEAFGERGLAAVVDEGHWAWINRAGELLPTRPFVFDNGADPWSDGRARYVDQDGRFGFVDENGTVAIPARFAFVRPFVQQRAAFCEGCKLEKSPGEDHSRVEGGRWGFVDLTGTAVIAPLYTTVSDFDGGTTKVCTEDGGCLELGLDGAVVATPETGG